MPGISKGLGREPESHILSGVPAWDLVGLDPEFDHTLSDIRRAAKRTTLLLQPDKKKRDFKYTIQQLNAFIAWLDGKLPSEEPRELSEDDRVKHMYEVCGGYHSTWNPLRKNPSGPEFSLDDPAVWQPIPGAYSGPGTTKGPRVAAADGETQEPRPRQPKRKRNDSHQNTRTRPSNSVRNQASPDREALSVLQARAACPKGHRVIVGIVHILGKITDEDSWNVVSADFDTKGKSFSLRIEEHTFSGVNRRLTKSDGNRVISFDKLKSKGRLCGRFHMVESVEELRHHLRSLSVHPGRLDRIGLSAYSPTHSDNEDD